MNNHLWLSSLVALITVICVTPLVMKFAIWIKATDQPNNRKVHKKVMPRLGGLAIIIGVSTAYLYSGLSLENISSITLGAGIIILLGLLDDIFALSAKIKLVFQLLAAAIVASSGLTIEFVNIPFVGNYAMGWLSIPLTVLWIVLITNAINLIDGLDGLAAGSSAIIIFTIGVVAYFNGKSLIFFFSLIILASVLGFLVYNFHPAKIFMGDIGALFLGYSISILSLLGLYKSVTLFSIVVPILLLGVPIFDTSFAIIRRLANNRSITAPDNGHLHHRLLFLGLSHRNTVLVIYAMNALFSLIAIAFSRTTFWGSIILTVTILFCLELLAEFIGLVHERYTPLLSVFSKLKSRKNKE
ncbi:undecaprenyl/decaprenyl-phosphate alpha-N-acetylglucosaminyl 1-phosphate transferase [Fictibacillus sp. 7GRE50]|uniref:glycosyltransferase family 4 protein n=1 Tax=Fictibacillus sp. 7GRE50 TaxID=2745878 RepID=UPI0018CE22B6|nr:MraY family glycosyltransferase [Fictibacillus sp. 7GRE50]MBH0164074.1 undecaprenyl/decaprenyl-phosphate alpha-N-acetylglucosaminyl 1-phosphate transferase [Fictibacillus sp. 7GRE50]